ncbi:MAG: 50S ribosomal protein L10 [Christensenellaceae bacterium]|nr:50S ribosomal protein L10 [Christensenellaceae bacterium]MBR3843252.1 50S ribosomal protein L10 [Christensenellaceae bacterium]
MKEQVLKAKEAEVASIQEKISGSQGVVFYDYRGLTVAEVTALRNKMRAAGAEYKVLKNTMVKRAADNLGIEGLENVLEGPTAVIFGVDDPVAPAKILVDFIAEKKKTEIKGGILEGKEAIDPKAVANLAKLPSKEQLIANLMSVINGVTSKFVRTLEAIRVQKEEQEQA